MSERIRIEAAELELSRHALRRFGQRQIGGATAAEALASVRRSTLVGRRLRALLSSGHFGQSVRFAEGMLYALDGDTSLVWVLRPTRSGALVVLTCLALANDG